jgi:hypothetical protein
VLSVPEYDQYALDQVSSVRAEFACWMRTNQNRSNVHSSIKDHTENDQLISYD